MMKLLKAHMKWIMVIIVIAFLLSTFLMYEGRSPRRGPGELNADGTMSDYEVAQINGRPLMRSELERMRVTYLENAGIRNTESIDMALVYRDVLSQVILNSQMSKEVEERGIRISDSEADAAMKAQADRYYVTREAFYRTLQQRGIKVDDYKRDLARQMAQEVLLREAIGEIDISEDQAVQFYDNIKNTFLKQPERYSVNFADFRNFDAAENFRTVIENGESWDVAAKAVNSSDVINITTDPVMLSAVSLNSGSMNFLASYDIGEVSRVIEMSSNDFTVAMKIEHLDESILPYDEVSADIKQLMTQQEAEQRVRDFQAGLISKAQVVINDNALFQSTNTQPASSDQQGVISDLLLDEPEVDGEYEPEDEAESRTEEPANNEGESRTEEPAQNDEADSKTEELAENAEAVVSEAVEKIEEPAQEIKEAVEEGAKAVENEVTETINEAENAVNPIVENNSTPENETPAGENNKAE